MSNMFHEKGVRKMNSIRQIEVIYDNRPVGRMALTKDGLCAFEYSNEWLNSGFSTCVENVLMCIESYIAWKEMTIIKGHVSEKPRRGGWDLWRHGRP